MNYFNLQNQKTVNLFPAGYSKAKSMESIVLHIRAHPEQDTNNEKAYKHSIEFQENGKGPVGTLSEYVEHVTSYRHCYFIIFPLQGNGMAIVKYNEEGNCFNIVDWSA